MALTTESHTLRVRTGECYRDRSFGETGDLLDRSAQAKALRKNIHHQYYSPILFTIIRLSQAGTVHKPI